MKYRPEKVNDDGWTDWIQPHHASYQMRCCDCDLVHEFQFRVVRDDPNDPQVDPEKVRAGLVVMRARRNNRATAASRRHKK